MTLPSPLLLLSLAALLFLAFLLTTTALPSLLLFGDIDRGIAISKREDYLKLAEEIFKVKGEEDA